MAEAGVCVLLLFCFLFSGLVYYTKFVFEHGDKIKTKERPNFIIILADDIGWGDLWTNKFDNTTPWLNMLKLEGKRFSSVWMKLLKLFSQLHFRNNQCAHWLLHDMKWNHDCVTGLQTFTLLLPHVPPHVLRCWLVDTAYAMESLTILQRGLLEDYHLMRQHLLSSYMIQAITLPWLVNTARFRELFRVTLWLTF